MLAVRWSQYRPRERVDQTLNQRIDGWTHPLTRVVLTSPARYPHSPGTSVMGTRPCTSCCKLTLFSYLTGNELSLGNQTALGLI
jgi:hypothetical protein